MATTQRRLRLTGLSFHEHVDVVSSFIAIAFLSGDYDVCVRLMTETLDALRPGEPPEVFANTLNAPIFALYSTGRWSEASRFHQAAEEIRQRSQGIEGAGHLLLGTYQVLLFMALSREDQTQIDALEAVARQL